MDKNGQRVACKNWNVYSPQRQNNLIFFWLPYSGLGKAAIYPGCAMQLDALAFLPHPTDITDPPPRPFASVRFDPLAWSSGSDQRRISGCGTRWLLAGPDSLPLWLCRVCAFVLLRCFSCSHTVLPKEHSLGVIFFSSLSSCKCCIFLQFYLHFTTDYTCMIVYVTNNKEPWIEHLWDVVERVIRIMDVQRTNLQQLHDAIVSILTIINEECFQHLVESMPRRIKAVLKAKVGPTSKVYLIKWPVIV